MIDVLDFIWPLVWAQQGLLAEMVPCVVGCGAFLARLPMDTTDPAVRVLGRQCPACYERQERGRAH